MTYRHVAVWNLACGFAKNEKQLIAFRFLAGLGGSAPLTVYYRFSLVTSHLTSFRSAVEYFPMSGEQNSAEEPVLYTHSLLCSVPWLDLSLVHGQCHFNNVASIHLFPRIAEKSTWRWVVSRHESRLSLN